MAKVTPNIASNLTPGVTILRKPSNPSKSPGQTSQYAGFNPEYAAGDTQKSVGSNHFASRNSQGGHKVFTNEAKRPGTDNVNQKFYAHIS